MLSTVQSTPEEVTGPQQDEKYLDVQSGDTPPLLQDRLGMPALTMEDMYLGGLMCE